MKSYFYTATDPSGVQVKDQVSAATSTAALATLVANGLSNIRFVSTEAGAQEPNGLSRGGLAQIATFQRLINTRPSVLAWLKAMLWSRRYFMGVGLLTAIAGLVVAGWLWVAIGLFLACAMPLWDVWKYRGVTRYERLLRAYARGDHKTVVRHADWLTRNVADEKVVLDAAMRKACVLAKHESLFVALESLEDWSLLPKDERPVNFDSRIATVYYFGGDDAQYLKSTQEAYFQDSDSAIATLDLAIAEARCGDEKKAEMLMKGLSTQGLPAYGLPFVDWTNGLIKQRRNDPTAQQEFGKAVSGFFSYGEYPIIWTAIAMCVGDYAISARDDVGVKSAEQLLQPVWPMLKFHGKPEVVDKLAQRYPALSST